MRLSNVLLALFRFLLPPAIICTLLLYFNAPLLDCTFPLAWKPEAGCSIPGQQKAAIPGENAPFRLLALADPQLEGDSSVQSVDWAGLEWQWKILGLPGLVYGLRDCIGAELKRWRKKIDLWGNDLYLAHIYRGVHWWSQPTHVVVLGDLLGSQWVSDDEFKKRSDRFWKKVFRGSHKVPPSITGSSGRVEVLGQDEDWKNRIIAVAGNHDIGYAGDIDSSRIDRFERTFGDVNWDITFRLPSNTTSHPTTGLSSTLSSDPELHLVILNSMNLDSPAKDQTQQQASRDFALSALTPPPQHRRKQFQPTLRSDSATVLLTHIPLHKERGICVDSEYFSWFPPTTPSEDGSSPDWSQPSPDAPMPGGIKEQNHLSKETSELILDTMMSSTGKFIILNGHDHEGCNTYHYRPAASCTPPLDSDWKTVRLDNVEEHMVGEEMTGLREITVRSMMGEFWGNVGFLSAWFDKGGDGEPAGWKFEYHSCGLGVQHFWWGVHVFDVIVVGLGIGGLALMVLEEMAEAKAEERERLASKKTL